MSECRHIDANAGMGSWPTPRRPLRSRWRSRLSICRHSGEPTGRQVDALASSLATTARYATRCGRVYASTSAMLDVSTNRHVGAQLAASPAGPLRV
jgi:hypothetical protein